LISSMTAFARREADLEAGTLTWEIKSVNHRYQEIATRFPEELRHLEPQCRSMIAKVVRRGRIDAGLRYKAATGAPQRVMLDLDAVRSLRSLSEDLNTELPNLVAPSLTDVLAWPGVVSQKELDTDTLERSALNLLEVSLDDLAETRRREGLKIRDLLVSRLDTVEGIIGDLQQRLPEIQALFRSGIEQKIADVLEQVDPQRLEQEMVLLLNKSDVSEEIDRLSIHVEEVRRVLKLAEPVGRRLDFLMQELNREANTIGSKSQHADSTRASVDLKVVIEQMREQVQNLE
jgi:uncharacterized protein (TIGR00255 family)